MAIDEFEIIKSGWPAQIPLAEKTRRNSIKPDWFGAALGNRQAEFAGAVRAALSLHTAAAAQAIEHQHQRTNSMRCPAFFDDVSKIVLYDPLAEFLGAAEGGVIEYAYPDAVKSAGHSCPTVAGAYLMNLKALAALYQDGLPQRGGIRVQFRDDAADGVTGVVANVSALITGAAQDNGFKGIGGRFDRRNLLSFNAGFGAQARFERVDSGAAVAVSYRPERVPIAPAAGALMQKVAAGAASVEEAHEFRALWQDRVKRILIDHFADGEMIVLAKG